MGSSETRSSNFKYRPDIDGLRAIAILAVVIFHAFPKTMPGGFVGVDVFFVISGFLISKIVFAASDSSQFSFIHFYDRRIARIFPALLLVLIASSVVGWFILVPTDFARFGRNLFGGIFFYQNFMLWNEDGYFNQTTELKPLMHLWSLAIEEQFYLFYPLLILILKKLKVDILYSLIAMTTVSFAVNLLYTFTQPNSAFFLPHPRMWELLVGGILACLPIHTPKDNLSDSSSERFKNILSVLGVILIAASIFAINGQRLFPGWWALAPVLGTSLVIFAGERSWVNRKILNCRALVFIGLISYPLYLWHWPLLAFARFRYGEVLSDSFKVTIVAASLVLAAATYWVVELPLRKIRWPLAKRYSLVGIAIFIGLFGYYAAWKQGLVSRFPENLKPAVAVYNFQPSTRFGICWLRNESPFDEFPQECSDSEKTPFGRMVIWGDSHAASLYPGMKSYLNDRKIAQFTRDSCPPLLGYGYETCRKSNEFILSEIERLRFETVVLFAAWNRYGLDWRRESILGSALLASIDRLKKIGIKNIVVIGPDVQWPTDLPQLVYIKWLEGGDHKIVAESLENPLVEELRSTDKGLAKLLEQSQVAYRSIIASQCHKSTCLTRSSDTSGQLLTWDYGHPTVAGGRLISSDVFGQ